MANAQKVREVIFAIIEIIEEKKLFLILLEREH